MNIFFLEEFLDFDVKLIWRPEMSKQTIITGTVSMVERFAVSHAQRIYHFKILVFKKNGELKNIREVEFCGEPEIIGAEIREDLTYDIYGKWDKDLNLYIAKRVVCKQTGAITVKVGWGPFLFRLFKQLVVTFIFLVLAAGLVLAAAAGFFSGLVLVFLFLCFIPGLGYLLYLVKKKGIDIYD